MPSGRSSGLLLLALLQGDERIEFLARFLSRVRLDIVSGCWGWTGYRDEWGYGIVRCPGGCTQRTHRVSWVLSRGAIPDGLCALHRCDNPACVRPDHMFLGTNADNMADRNSKGRQAKGTVLSEENRRRWRDHPERCPRGERQGFAVLTEDQVREIRRLAGLGMSYVELSGLFPASPQCIGHVVRRRTWRHVA